MGLPLNAIILLSLVFTSQYMDYATDFLVSYSLCGRVVAIPFTARDCSFNGRQRCRLIEGFCGTFTAASAVDVVLCLALELVDLSSGCALFHSPSTGVFTGCSILNKSIAWSLMVEKLLIRFRSDLMKLICRVSMAANAISMVSQIVRLLIGSVMASAEETGGGGTGGERAILLISMFTTVLSFLLSINTVRDMMMRSAKKLKRLPHRNKSQMSLRGARVAPEVGWGHCYEDSHAQVQEDRDKQPISCHYMFERAQDVLPAVHAEAAANEVALVVGEFDTAGEWAANNAHRVSSTSCTMEELVHSALNAVVEQAAGEQGALVATDAHRISATSSIVEEVVDTVLDAVVGYAAGEFSVNSEHE